MQTYNKSMIFEVPKAKQAVTGLLPVQSVGPQGSASNVCNIKASG